MRVLRKSAYSRMPPAPNHSKATAALGLQTVIAKTVDQLKPDVTCAAQRLGKPFNWGDLFAVRRQTGHGDMIWRGVGDLEREADVCRNIVLQLCLINSCKRHFD